MLTQEQADQLLNTLVQGLNTAIQAFRAQLMDLTQPAPPNAEGSNGSQPVDLELTEPVG